MIIIIIIIIITPHRGIIIIIERFFSWIQKRCLQKLTNSNENKNNKKLCTIKIKKNYSKILKW